MLKRAFDLVLAALGLAVSGPLAMVIALAVKLEDGGPVLFRQTRVGLGGREFHTLKFRSMVPDAERRFGFVQAREGDPRITRVGRILRATALDELPQLWNIVVGDMSFVGPRPLCPGEVEVRGNGSFALLNSIRGYHERHSVRPGLTGLAQVHASRDIARSSKFRMDLLYIKRATFFLDMRLIALSFWITGRARWETRERQRSAMESDQPEPGPPARVFQRAGVGEPVAERAGRVLTRGDVEVRWDTEMVKPGQSR